MSEGFVEFLEELLKRKKIGRCQLARVLGLSHPTVGRWLTGGDMPSPMACKKLAEYSGVQLRRVFVMAGYLPSQDGGMPDELPPFGEYMGIKYPEVDADLVIALEEMVDRKGAR